jgi:alkylation response protein AidB-like acyl-CoA dehydrogenase
MNAQLSEIDAYEALAKRFRPVFAQIADGATAREVGRLLPFDEIELLRNAGFGAATVPVEFGGAGASVVDLFRLLIELGEADSNLPQLLRAHFASVDGWLTRPNDDRRERWLTRVAEGALLGNATHERSAAAVGGFTTQVSRTPAGLRLNGVKHYSTGSLFADWIWVAAVDSDGATVSLIVAARAPGVTRSDDWDGFGQRLTGSGTTTFVDVVVDPDELDPILPGPTHATALLQLVLLAALVGIGRSALRDAVSFVRSRTRVYSQGLADRASDDPLVQQVVGRLAGLVYSAEATTLEAARTLQAAHEAVIAGGPDAHTHIRRAELAAVQAQSTVTERVLEATTVLFEVGGASATGEARRLDRHWRNARTISSHNPVVYQQRAIGAELLTGDGLLFSWDTGEGSRR